MQEEKVTHGGISVDTEHIFPVIKKWLYSEKEIFLREIVSNASDAVTKLKRLASLGQYTADDTPYRITVSFHKSNKTLTVTDNGIGMTAEEVEKYLCRMAISGALDFIKQYENEDAQNGIIGHFGLGFYSAFMVADKVEVLTASYIDPESATHWTCDESGAYEIQKGIAEGRGTSVILHVNEDSEEYLNESKLRSILHRYCAFMPVEIFLQNEEEEEKKDALPINDTAPLWQKRPSECTEEEYTAFYKKAFDDYREPLFQLHINADYPLNFKGILYFPKIREQYEALEGKVKLYYNQVFVADNIKEVIPEFLVTVRGVLDCPDLPLNVSRSYLQNNAYVSRVSAHIVKKVADKLNAMLNTEREKYEKIWNDIRTFVEYGCVTDKKFYDRVIDAVLLPTTDGGFVTLADYTVDPETAETEDKEKTSAVRTVYYATDKDLQSQYIALYRAQGHKVVLLPTPLDVRFAETVEQHSGKLRFVRVDAATDALQGEAVTLDESKLKGLFEGLKGEEDALKIEVTTLLDRDVPAIIKVDENSRRMQDMMKMFAPDAPSMPTEETLVLNAASPLIASLAEEGEGERQNRIARQIYRLAQISQRTLSADEMQSFLADSYALLTLL